ncbi:MAG: hypothetical protein BWY84_00923 [Candidatus Aerophobetes bacterium ADurb.Bin490]|nr:MAG: hypothetical protein BWY84_00923 [Candidatus Aerophobetes bacterium ADurb.Bin490]
MPRLLAIAFASVKDSSEEYFVGKNISVTFSFPAASAAISDTIAESIPPLNATITFLNPFFLI